MLNKLTTESQVMSALGITDWRHLSKGKLMDFLSLLPNVDNEVAIKIIEQFPEFSKTSIKMLDIMRDLCNRALEDDKESSFKSIEAYEQVLDELGKLLDRDDLSTEDRKYFADKMIEIADKIGLKDTENKQFKSRLLNTVGGVIIAALLIGASVLGAKCLNSSNTEEKNLLDTDR